MLLRGGAEDLEKNSGVSIFAWKLWIQNIMKFIFYNQLIIFDYFVFVLWGVIYFISVGCKII
jgi:hypothetical protein